MSKLASQQRIREHINEFISSIHSTNKQLEDHSKLQLVSKLGPKELSLYVRVANTKPEKTVHVNSLANLSKAYTKETLQYKRRKELIQTASLWRQCIDIYNVVVPEKDPVSLRLMVFFTLTLSMPQHHTDQEIKRHCLNSFITSMKYRYTQFNYMWKAEKQGNGRIHFHFLTDRYVNKYDLQRNWNKAQNVLGYVDEYKNESGKDNPPSTHIKAAGSDNLTYNYIFDYLMKDEKYGPVGGIKAGMSDAVRLLKQFKHHWSDLGIYQLLRFLQAGKFKVESYDYCFKFYAKSENELWSYFPSLKEEYDQHLISMTKRLFEKFLAKPDLPGYISSQGRLSYN